MGKAAKKTRWRTFSFNSSKEEPTDSQTANKSSNDTSNKSSATTNGRTSPSSLNANYSQILSDNNNSSDSYHHYNNNNNNSNNYNNTNPGASSLNNRNNNNTNIHYNNGFKKHYTNNKENSNFATTGNSYYNRERSQRFISNKAPNSYYNKSNYNKDYRSGTGIVSNGKDKKLETKSNGEVSVEGEEKNETALTPPILFNEDEYTRITTPRQDVLFKKGYLSRMNNNKTATTTTNTNSTESTTTTNSDPDSSISTLSPATTPSTMEYSTGTKYSSDMVDSMDYPMYYPGCYYDENGVMVFPMYANGYNYYQNASNASSNASPVYLMPYPYSYDYYMPPTASTPPTSPANEEEEETTASTNNAEDKNTINEITNTTDTTTTTTSTNNTNNQHSDNGMSTPISSSEDGVSSSNQGEENVKEDTSNIPSDNLSNASGNSTSPTEKPLMPICPNEINGFIYPAGPNYNGYYNNFYYYNGASQMPTRPPKYKSRKRFTRARNSSQQSQNSAETTTDYSDEDSVAATTTQPQQYQQQFTYNRRYNNNYHYNNRYHNGYHHNNHHNYHNGGRYNDRDFHHEIPVDFTNLVLHTNLNVDVQEFYPRHNNIDNVENCDSINVPSAKTVTNGYHKSAKWEAPGKMQDKSQIKDKEEKIKTKDGDNEKTITVKDVASKVTKQSSHNGGKFSSRVTKKENIESIKQMEQQNIDLLAISKLQTKPVKELDVEWNVIKKGKRIKVVNKNGVVEEAQKEMVKLEKVSNETTKDTPIPEQAQNTDENSKESIVVTKEVSTKPTAVIQKPKKSKTKNKKNKKLVCGSKLDGFEIIEPDFGVKVSDIQEKQEADENGIDDSDEDSTVPIENGLSHDSDEDVTISDEIKEMSEEDIAELLKENAAPTHLDDEKDAELIEILNDLLADDDNEIIDISDDDICPKMVSPPPVLAKIAKSKKVEIKEETVIAIAKQEVEKSINPEKTKEPVKFESKEIKSEVSEKTPQITTPVAEIVVRTPQVNVTAIEKPKETIKSSDVQKIEEQFNKIVKPILRTETPVKKVETSIEKVKTSVQEAKTPVLNVEVPVKNVDTTVNMVKASVTKDEAPVHKTEAKVHKVEAPVLELETPVHRVEAPVLKVEVPIHKLEKPFAEVQVPVMNSDAQVKIVDAPIFKTEVFLPKIQVPVKKVEATLMNVTKPVLKFEETTNKIVESAKNQENKIKNIENSIKNVKDPVKSVELKIETTPAVYQNGIKEKKMVEVEEEIIVATKATSKQKALKEESPVFDYNYKIKENVADLERDLKKNLRLLNGDEDIQLKSPIINPLTDFPITNAIQKWLQTKQNESFDSLFHVQNFKKLHLHEDEKHDGDDEDDDDDYEGDDTEEEDTESEISDKPITDDSDYASDIQVKANTDGANDQAGPSSIASSNSKLNNVVNGKSKNDVKVTKLNANMVKDKLCAIM